MRVLVTGAAGQIGTELVPAMRAVYGDTAVLATDVREPVGEMRDGGPWAHLDAMDEAALGEAVRSHRTKLIMHLAAVLSATGEQDPQRAWSVNMTALRNVLDAAREADCALFVPSSIAVFGPMTPRDPAPQDATQRPTTMYGITKVAGELLCDYFHARFGVDTRGLRYPGLISWTAPPGGGTTDYAVAIYHEALARGRYTCFLSADTQLDMMYMPDAVRAAMELMEADPARLRHRNAFNVTAMQLTPALVGEAIREHLPGFRIAYDVDPVRQAIADSWPRRIDDEAARREWGWRPQYDLARMTADMLQHLRTSTMASVRTGTSA